MFSQPNFFFHTLEKQKNPVTFDKVTGLFFVKFN